MFQIKRLEDECKNRYTIAHEDERGIGVAGCDTHQEDADKGESARHGVPEDSTHPW